MATPDSAWSVLVLGFALGLVHACDADHIMAVSALSLRRAGTRLRPPLRHCLRWALGHGGVLLVLCLALLALDLQLPPSMMVLAEHRRCSSGIAAGSAP